LWHKEILFALSAGVEVIGAASMGALRAAELHPFGMLGVGRAYRLFRSGHLTDDDELAVIHAPDALAFRPLSDAMINVRFTLRRLRRLGVLSRASERELVAHMKALHFSSRTPDELGSCASRIAGAREVQRIADAYVREYVDVKRIDARALVAAIARPGLRSRPARAWRFPATGHWHKQFEREIADVPPLR